MTRWQMNKNGQNIIYLLLKQDMFKSYYQFQMVIEAMHAYMQTCIILTILWSSEEGVLLYHVLISRCTLILPQLILTHFDPIRVKKLSILLILVSSWVPTCLLLLLIPLGNFKVNNFVPDFNNLALLNMDIVILSLKHMLLI